MTIIVYSISGSAGIAGATVTLSGQSSGSTTADGSGNYSFGGLGAGNYTVTPSLAGYTFSPVNQNVTLGPSATGISFTATSNTYSITGNTTVPNTTVSYSGTVSGSVTSDGSGNYTISGLSNGTYTLTPSKTGYSFSPTSLIETISGLNLTGVNFSMAATLYALQGRYSGSSLINAFAGGEPVNQDILQLVIVGDESSGDPPIVTLNVDYTGAVHNPAVSPTQGTRVGTFATSAASGGTTAQKFAGAWPTNPSSLDIIQVINEGGNISYWLDVNGVAHGS